MGIITKEGVMSKILLLVMVMALALCSNVYAQAEMVPLVLGNRVEPAEDFLKSVNSDNDGRGDVFTNKLGDGVLNIATCWTDVPKRADKVTQDKGALEGYTVGLGEGVLQGVARVVSGAYDTATFILPPYDEPMMKPEYSVNQPNKEGLKVVLASW